jgi:hypothetical protein
MFFYTALFIASVIVAFVLLYLYRSLWEVASTIYKVFLPSAKTNHPRQAEDENLATSINRTPTPWGWDGRATSENANRPQAARQSGQTPWGWPGNDHEIRERSPGNRLLNSLHSLHDDVSATGADRNPTVGWPYREEEFEFAGKTYKITRKATPERSNLKTTGKPWGW